MKTPEASVVAAYASENRIEAEHVRKMVTSQLEGDNAMTDDATIYRTLALDAHLQWVTVRLNVKHDRRPARGQLTDDDIAAPSPLLRVVRLRTPKRPGKRSDP